MIYDVAILGAGPAGLTAGIYTARQGMSVILITKNLGGQMTQKAVAIENYPGFENISGLDLIQKMESQVQFLKIPIKNEEFVSLEKNNDIFKIILKNEEIIESRSIILASGSQPRNLNVPGEKEFIGRGVSYCTTCDGPLFQNKDIAIIGGGNAGFEAGIFMSTYANNIYILEYNHQFGADKENQKKASALEKIKLITSAELKEIKGDNFVREIVYFDKKENQEKVLPVSGVFVQAGWQPASSFVNNWVELNERKEIIINHKTMTTKTPGIFAAGDVTDGFVKQIVCAAGDGAKAAISAYKYLQSN
ncbi:MAG: FAD-dependent oxidoreductase [Candidatus Paceibacterota bacterium]